MDVLFSFFRFWSWQPACPIMMVVVMEACEPSRARVSVPEPISDGLERADRGWTSRRVAYQPPGPRFVAQTWVLSFFQSSVAKAEPIAGTRPTSAIILSWTGIRSVTLRPARVHLPWYL